MYTFGGLLEPCIEPLCSEFSEKMRLNQTCVPGRCECPEERQFCTNTDSTWVNNLKKGNRRQAMTNNDVNEEVQKILSDWEPLIREGSLATIYTLVICTILVMTHGAPEVLQHYSLYIFAFNVYLIIMCSLVVLGYYNRVGDITIYLLVPCIFFGTVYCIIIVCNGYVIPYILNRFFPDDDTPQDNVEVQQDEAQVQPDEAQSDFSEVQNEVNEVHNESPNISASSTQSLHSRGRGRKKGGKKRRR